MIENAGGLRTALQNARNAYSQGDHSKVRYWARLAIQIDPNVEESWLWLAAVSSPRASLAYLQKALTINPNSQRARQGIHWAINRIRAEPAAALPIHPIQQVKPPAVSAPIKPGKVKPHLYWWAPIILILVVISSALVSPAFGFNINTYFFKPDPLVAAQVGLFKASNTPTSTNTPTNTPSPTPTSTQTSTPTETSTPTPTETPTSTFTPYPTDTEIPTEEPTEYVLPEPVGEGRWIDVDLTNQLVYAYEEDEIVNTFLVSTGTWEHPTVTGQYHIYVKYEYADMEGPGYYLPDVPYVMYFYDGYGLHGTYWHNNFGTPMSHGCINLSIPDSEWLFYWADVGTLVNIHY